MVLFCHARWPQPTLAGLANYGALGVDLFFAISGFLITRRLIEERSGNGGISLRAFYVRRLFRIIPPAAVYLAAVAFAGLALHLIPMNAGPIAARAVLYGNYYSMDVEHSWYTGHFWSLSVEEHFYLLWPGLLLLFGVRRGRILAPSLSLAIAAWRAFDTHFAWIASFAPALKDSPARTDYRLDGLLWGCALAFFWNAKRAPRWLDTKLLVCVAASAVFLAWAKPVGYATGLAVLFPLAIGCTVAQPHAAFSRFLEARPVVWIGRLSYSLYLWQQLFLPTRGVPQSFGVLQTFPLNIGFAVAAAAASYYAIERPFIAWGRRWTASTPHRGLLQRCSISSGRQILARTERPCLSKMID